MQSASWAHNVKAQVARLQAACWAPHALAQVARLLALYNRMLTISSMTFLPRMVTPASSSACSGGPWNGEANSATGCNTDT